MKKFLIIMVILIFATPVFADFNFNAGWNDDSPGNVRAELILDLNGNGQVDAGEVKCSVDQGQPSLCSGTAPDSFVGKQYWVRTFNIVGQLADTEKVTFTVLPPSPATGIFFNATWFQP